MKRLAIVLVAVIALSLRLFNAFFLPWQGGDLIVSDMKGYDRAAMALLEQKPLSVHTAERYIFHPLGSDTYHPPGYYYFLAGLYAIAGHSYLVVRIAQSLLGTLTCVGIYFVGRELFDDRAGLLAAALAAAYPPLVFYTGVLLTETLSTFLLTGATCLLLRYTHARFRYALLCLAGLFLGCATITRSILLITVPFVLLWLLLVDQRWPGWPAATRHALALMMPVVLLVAPVTFRNYQIHHRFILLSTNGGVNFFLGHGGTQRLKNDVRNLPEVIVEGQVVGVSHLTQPEEDTRFYQLGWEHIVNDPLETLGSIPGKLIRMYWDSDYWPASDAQVSIMRRVDWALWKLLLLPLSVVGIALHDPQKRRRTSMCCLLIASSLTMPLVFWAMPRFRVPMLPCFVVLAAGTVSRLCCGHKQLNPSNLEALAL